MPTYNFPTHKRGDTFVARTIAVLTDTDTGDPVGVSGALLQVRKKLTGAVVHEWSTAEGTIIVSGAGSNRITMEEVSAAVTATWATGSHAYDLEITLENGITITAPEGDFTITADVSRK